MPEARGIEEHLADLIVGISEYQPAHIIFDGLSALVSAPEVAPQIVGIVVGSTIKGLITGVLITLIAVWVLSPPPEAQPVTRMAMVLPAPQRLFGGGRQFLALSPDGRHLVYSADNQLYLRAMDDLELQHLVRVITECSLLLSDVYSEDRLARIMHPERGFLASLVSQLIEQQRRGEGEVLYRVRRLPEDVRRRLSRLRREMSPRRRGDPHHRGRRGGGRRGRLRRLRRLRDVLPDRPGGDRHQGVVMVSPGALSPELEPSALRFSGRRALRRRTTMK